MILQADFGATLILFAITLVLGELIRASNKIEDAKPAGLGDFQLPTATQGRSVPLVWGTVMIKGPNVVWYGDLMQVAQKSRDGSYFSNAKVITGYKYWIGIQFALCRGEIDHVRKIRIGNKTAFDGTATSLIEIDDIGLFGGSKLGTGGVSGDVRIHLGSSTQAANAYLSDFQDVGGVTPTYPGTTYLVFEGGYIGDSTNIAPWAFEIRRIPNGLGLGSPSVNSGMDANPMNVIYELMTNIEWGLGMPDADIDISNFTSIAATLESEGNGYSRVLDRQVEAIELLREIESQIDGVVYVDQQTGKWKVKLARDDYDIDTVPQLNESNILEATNYSRGAWEDTTNSVKVEFSNRENEYADDFAVSQDMANAMVQGGGTVQTGLSIQTLIKYPGVKDSALANAIAWRDLRPLSYPLAKVTLTVDRSFWALTPGQVVAWSDDDLGLVKLPMRIVKIDQGTLQDGRIQLQCVQDVFKFEIGLYDDPPGSGWTPPGEDLDEFPADEQIAIEAPRGLVYRDPNRTGDMLDKIWCTGRQQDEAVGFFIHERHASGAPVGDYTEVGELYGFMLIGELKNDTACGCGAAIPVSAILITATPDTQELLETAFEDDPDIVGQGTNLGNMVMVGTEFMIPRSATESGADVSLNDVYRGVLDGGQQNHAAGTPVYLVFVSGGLIDTTIPDGQNVDLKLLPFSQYDTVAEVDANTIQITMDDRLIRPYPPASLDLNGTLFPIGTVSLDYLASGAAETTGMDMDFIRKDYRTGEGGDEIAALLVDASTIFSDYPSANNTTHIADVWNDPDGSPALLFSEEGITTASQDILRLKILKETDGVVPSRMRIVLESMHDAGGKTDLHCTNHLSFDFDTASAALAGQFNYGALDTNDGSNVYTADAAGTHAFTLSSAFSAGQVQYRKNGGSWLPLIPAGTTGNIVGISVSDTIEIRHTSGDTDALKQIDMVAPGAGTDAYGVLFT